MRVHKIVYIALMVVFLTSCTKVDFDGSISANDEEIILDLKTLNYEINQNMELVVGEAVGIKARVNKGVFKFKILDPSKNPVFTGNFEEDTEFQVTIHTSGQYSFVTEGNQAGGQIYVTRLKTKE